MVMAAVCLLQVFPPTLSSSNPSKTRRPKYSPFTTHNNKRLRNIVSSSTTTTTSSINPDDYHATLKALNSKNRTPRKSLGQVILTLENSVKHCIGPAISLASHRAWRFKRGGREEIQRIGRSNVFRYARHYMLNSSINEQLVKVADVKEGDVVLEIGPGTGSLTNVLLEAGATVLAIEKDPQMAALVSERFLRDKLQVVQEDFTKCHIRSHMLPLMENRDLTDIKSKHAKVVANIPFNISTDIVKELLPMGDIFSEVVLLLQDETALRMVESSLRTSEYRPINIFINFYSDPEYNFQVPRTNFFPQPNVDAAVVTFKLKQPTDYPPILSTKSFFSMVNSAFSGKRKMLRRSLQHLCTALEIEEALEKVGLPATSRPGELTVDDFVRLHNLIVRP